MKHPRLKTLLSMLLVMAAIVAYSLYPNDLQAGSLALKKLSLSFSDTSLDDLETVEEEPQADSVAVQETVVHQPDTTRHKFLLIGDSMLEGLAPCLQAYAENNGNDYFSVIWYSSTSQRWAQTNTLDHFIQQQKPTYIIVCLGANELFVKDLDARDKYIQTLISKIGDRPYVWIGPPNWKPDTGINKLILKNVGKGRFFDSSNLELDRRKDHAHPTLPAARKWFALVAEWMQSSQCAHSIRMTPPEKPGRLKNVKMLAPDFKGY